jgi:hypothetical protein
MRQEVGEDAPGFSSPVIMLKARHIEGGNLEFAPE